MQELILIPTDFSVSSLNSLKQALKNAEDSVKRYILIFESKTSDSITDLLFSSKRNVVESHSNELFMEGLSILKSKYASVIESLTIEPFYGYTKAAFNNFIIANKVSEIYVPSDKNNSQHPELKTLTNYVKKLGLSHKVVDWELEVEDYSSNTILQLFKA